MAKAARAAISDGQLTFHLLSAAAVDQPCRNAGATSIRLPLCDVIHPHYPRQATVA